MTDLDFVNLLDAGVTVKLSTPYLGQTIEFATMALYKGASVKIDNSGSNYVVEAVLEK